MSATKGIEEALELAEAADQETVLVLTHELKHLVLENQLLRNADASQPYLDALDELTDYWQAAQQRQIDGMNRLLDKVAELQQELDEERSGRATKRTKK